MEEGCWQCDSRVVSDRRQAAAAAQLGAAETAVQLEAAAQLEAVKLEATTQLEAAQMEAVAQLLRYPPH